MEAKLKKEKKKKDGKFKNKTVEKNRRIKASLPADQKQSFGSTPCTSSASKEDKIHKRVKQ